MCFQIVDDILDITGSQQSLGKPVFSDLREGKLTLPFILLLPHLAGQRAAGSLEEILATGEFRGDVAGAAAGPARAPPGRRGVPGGRERVRTACRRRARRPARRTRARRLDGRAAVRHRPRLLSREPRLRTGFTLDPPRAAPPLGARPQSEVPTQGTESGGSDSGRAASHGPHPASVWQRPGTVPPIVLLPIDTAGC